MTETKRRGPILTKKEHQELRDAGIILNETGQTWFLWGEGHNDAKQVAFLERLIEKKVKAHRRASWERMLFAKLKSVLTYSMTRPFGQVPLVQFES